MDKGTPRSYPATKTLLQTPTRLSLKWVLLTVMSLYVAKFFSTAPYSTHSKTRTTGTPTNLIQSVVSIVSFILSFSRSLRSHVHVLIDSPELGPGADLGPSGVSTSSSASPTRSPQGRVIQTRAQSWVVPLVVFQQSSLPLP